MAEKVSIYSRRNKKLSESQFAGFLVVASVHGGVEFSVDSRANGVEFARNALLLLSEVDNVRIVGFVR